MTADIILTWHLVKKITHGNPAWIFILNNEHFIGCVPFLLFSIFCSLPVFPEIMSHVNTLYMNPWLRICFGGKSKLRPCCLVWETRSATLSEKAKWLSSWVMAWVGPQKPARISGSEDKKDEGISYWEEKGEQPNVCLGKKEICMFRKWVFI